MLKYLEKDLKLDVCKPTHVQVKMIGDNQIENVVVFDVKKMIASLFADPILNQYKNLVVNPHNRFSKYEPEDN